MGKDLLILKARTFFYTHWERSGISLLRWVFSCFTQERKTINPFWKERSLLTEVLSSNPTFGLNPLETKSHNLILATVTLKAGYTGLILVLERAQDFKFESFYWLEIEKMACFGIGSLFSAEKFVKELFHVMAYAWK